jgi:hypothetical protein
VSGQRVLHLLARPLFALHLPLVVCRLSICYIIVHCVCRCGFVICGLRICWLVVGGRCTCSLVVCAWSPFSVDGIASGWLLPAATRRKTVRGESVYDCFNE